MYRDSAAVTRVPLEQIAWRRRVGRAAVALTVSLLLAVQWVVSGGPDRWLAAAAWCAVAGSAWVATTPRPGRRRGWLEWVLLVCMVGVGLLAVVGMGGMLGAAPMNAVVFVGLAAGLELVARLLAGAGYRKRARVARALMIGAALGLALAPYTFLRIARDVTKILSLALTAGALFLVSRVAGHAEVVGHSWWLDDGASIPEEWVSLFLLRDGHAEVISAGGELGRFQNQSAAFEWLEQKGYVPGSVAVERGLVVAEPPALFSAKR